MLEHGAYRQLLDALYASGEPIAEADVNRVALAFTAAEQGAVRAKSCATTGRSRPTRWTQRESRARNADH